jgi:hypothetical protein
MDRLVAVVLALLCTTSCARHDRQLQDHEKSFESLSSSAKATVEAWLRGSVSGTYTSVALDRVLALTEQERSTLAASPQMLIDARGASLSDSAAQLSRHVAAMISDVRRADGESARRHVAALPFSEQP